MPFVDMLSQQRAGYISWDEGAGTQYYFVLEVSSAFACDYVFVHNRALTNKMWTAAHIAIGVPLHGCCGISNPVPATLLQCFGDRLCKGCHDVGEGL